VIGTHLAAVGPWRATVTEYDWEYVEDVQAGSGGDSGGGHASGGTLSQLYHAQLGPILVASMTKYALIEMSNQQQFHDAPHMTLTPRIECAGKENYTSLDDLNAVVKTTGNAREIVFDVKGRLLTTGHRSVPDGEVLYHLLYRLSEAGVEIEVSTSGTAPAPPRLILPVIARGDEALKQLNPQTVRIGKANGTLTVSTDAASGFETVPMERTFNLVPGFEAVPLEVVLEAGKETHVRIEGLLAKVAI
jgi:hypothetical protein